LADQSIYERGLARVRAANNRDESGLERHGDNDCTPSRRMRVVSANPDSRQASDYPRVFDTGPPESASERVAVRNSQEVPDKAEDSSRPDNNRRRQSKCHRKNQTERKAQCGESVSFCGPQFTHNQLSQPAAGKEHIRGDTVKENFSRCEKRRRKFKITVKKEVAPQPNYTNDDCRKNSSNTDNQVKWNSPRFPPANRFPRGRGREIPATKG